MYITLPEAFCRVNAPFTVLLSIFSNWRIVLTKNLLEILNYDLWSMNYVFIFHFYIPWSIFNYSINTMR